jgi:putative endonuclease
MFESCWAHHSTRLHLAVGETKSRSWRAIRPSNALLALSAVEGSERSESKGHHKPFVIGRLPTTFHFNFVPDDGIVVGMWFVYILRCADGSFYVGETNDVSIRLADHNRGRGGPHTAKRRPVTLAYVEEHPSRVDSLNASVNSSAGRAARKRP